MKTRLLSTQCIYAYMCLCLCICTCMGMTCIDKCNLALGFLPRTDICGSDGNDYNAPLAAIVGVAPPLFTCYRKCGVGVLYPGTCGCPNACNDIASKGACNNGTCECAKGWGGVDCSAVVCPHNKCSGNGECVAITDHRDACACNKGFTGDDCSIAVLDVSAVPYGEILPGAKYYQNDKYEDHHPIFDIKRIANIHIRLDKSDFQDIFNPVNTWNQSYVDGSFTFSNGKVQDKHHKVSIKLKGHVARIAVKKSFILKFNDEKFHGLKHLVFKAPSLDPTYLHNQLITEFYRAMRVPTVRASFATLTINGVYYGLYNIYEELDEDFIETRYDNTDGNYYSLSTYLKDLGTDPEAYKNETIENVGRTLLAYKQDFGDGSYNDLAQLGHLMNESAPIFEAGMEENFNVDYFLRSLVVISAVDNYDSSPRDGNNWVLYNLPVNDTHFEWQYIPKDHEFSFLNPLADPYLATKNTLSLAHHVLRADHYHKKYNEYYKIFLNNVLDPSLENSVISRIDSFEPVLKTIIKGDYSYHITNGIPMGEFNWELCVKESKVFLHLRYDYLRKRLLL